MKGDQLPRKDHVVRYCKFETLDEEGVPTGDAFRLRIGKEDYVSTNWLERLDPNDRNAALAQVRAVLASKMKLGAKACLAVLSIATTMDHVFKSTSDGRLLRFLHEPLKNPLSDPSHAGIYDTEPEGGLIGDLIAETIVDVQNARVL